MVSDKNRTFGIHFIDSTPTTSGFRYFFNTYLSSLPATAACAYNGKSNPMGKHVDISTEAATLFTDGNFAIPLKFNPTPGDTVAILYANTPSDKLYIIFKTQYQADVFGSSDSVRIYSVPSNTDITYYDSLVLSKSYGIVRMPNIRILDSVTYHTDTFYKYEWNMPGSFQLAGHSHAANSPLKKITYKDCFDFEVGDLHQKVIRTHTKFYSGKELFRTIYFKDIIFETVLSKEENNDSIYYTIQRQKYISTENKTDSSWSFTENTTIDTTLLTISKSPQRMDSVPGTLVYSSINGLPGSSSDLFVWNKSYNNLQAVEELSNVRVGRLTGTDSCYTLTYNNSISFNTNETYVKSLGGPYFSATINEANNVITDVEVKLLYYSNNNATWGTPYPFPLGLKKNYGDQTSIINVYPNPASEQFNVASKDMQSITITDITGRVMYENQMPENSSVVNCSTWPAGVYMVKINHANQSHIKKVIVIR
jgi:hypothetical protein